MYGVVMPIRREGISSGQDPSNCPGDQCFQLLARRWNAFIIWALLDQPRRFTDLLELIDGVSDRMLIQRLRELEGAGIVSRSRHREVPPRVVYALTDAGQALRPIIEAMEEWGARWASQSPGSPPSSASAAN